MHTSTLVSCGKSCQPDNEHNYLSRSTNCVSRYGYSGFHLDKGTCLQWACVGVRIYTGRPQEQNLIILVLSFLAHFRFPFFTMDENQVASPNDPLIPKDNERSRRHKHQKRLLFALGLTTLSFLVISCIVLFFVSKNSATGPSIHGCMNHYFIGLYAFSSSSIDPSGYHGHIVSGKTGAVAVEAEECSNTGIESRCPFSTKS